MLISKKILGQFVPDISEIGNDKIGQTLTYKLAEVEGVTQIASKLKNIVVGKVIELDAHPNADKLNVCIVDCGAYGKKLQIVCGAPNVAPDMHVAVCLPGGIVYDSQDNTKIIEIKSTKLRGVKSEGMICSEAELGIGDSHEGVLRLDQNLLAGSEFDDELIDSIFEIENKSITHRGDCFSHLGISRELAAIFDLSMVVPETEPTPMQTANLPIEISVETNKVLQLNAITITDVEIKESPFWLKLALMKIGQKPVNNVVDITNYLMHLYGQPLHAYDYTEVESNKLVAREASHGEKFEAIDHNEYILTEGDLVISDKSKILGLAGVIGGKSTEISTTTKDIVLEAAVFDPTTILKQSRSHGIRSEAAIRFSKNIDPLRVVETLKIAANMCLDLAGGDIGSEILSIHSKPYKEKLLDFDLQQARKLSGVNVDFHNALISLEKLGFQIDNKHDSLKQKSEMVNIPLKVLTKIPSWRHDVSIEEDIIEEIVRMYGYDKIEPTLPKRSLKATPKNQIRNVKTALGKILQNRNYKECITYSFISEDLQTKFELDRNKLPKIVNAISPDLKYVRATIVPSLFEKLLNNYQKHNLENIKLFEIDRVVDPYSKLEDIGNTNVDPLLPEQPFQLATADSYEFNPNESRDWAYRQKFLISSKFEIEQSILKLLQLDKLPKNLGWRPFKPNYWPLVSSFLHKTVSSVLVNTDTEDVYGYFGEISPLILEHYGLSLLRVSIAEFNLNKLIKYRNTLSTNQQFVPISNLPKVTRDLSIELDSHFNYQKLASIFQQLNQSHKDINITVSLTDVYPLNTVNDKIYYSYTFQVEFVPVLKTLNTATVNEIVSQLTKQIVSLGLSIRD